MSGTHLGLSCTQSAPLPVYTETTLIKQYGGPVFLILCAQERALRGTHLGLSCTQPTPPPETTIPDSTVAP